MLRLAVILAVLPLAAFVVAAADDGPPRPAPGAATARAEQPLAQDAAAFARLRGDAQRAAVTRARAAAYRRNARARVPRAEVEPYLPLYRAAAEHYDVPWELLASIHKQETAFSTAPGTYKGLNFAGCCAGPMQFNLTNKPVSTWKRFGGAYATGPPRPASYPHRTARHPSPYDDWDAIIAAARLVAANGAGRDLDAAAWRSAYLYYGPGNLDEDDFGITYADEVVARALGWKRRGFCVACPTDRRLVRAVHDAWALGPIAQPGEKGKRKRKKRRGDKDARPDERRREAARGRSRAPRPARPQAPATTRAPGRRPAPAPTPPRREPPASEAPGTRPSEPAPEPSRPPSESGSPVPVPPAPAPLPVP